VVHMRMPVRMQVLGFSLSFWAILAVVYPTVKILETCERACTLLCSRGKS